MTVVILGAGVDATDGIGMPLTNEIIPQINEFINTEEGKNIDNELRSRLPNLRFHFDKFIKDTIDRIAQDFGQETRTISRNIQQELETNDTLTDNDRKMGTLIVAILAKVNSLQEGAILDKETAELIEELFGQGIVDDETIVDFNKLVYTDTFKTVMRHIMEQSMSQPNNVILKHVYRNLLDIEDILVKYFIGFYTGNISYIKTYIYISWMLWCFMKVKEKEIFDRYGDSVSEDLPVYSKIPVDWEVITFNYSSFAYFFNQNNPLYFHGNLFKYIDIHNKTEITIGEEEYDKMDIANFLKDQIMPNLSFNDTSLKYTIPMFLPPMKIKPVLSRSYIKIWFKSEKVIKDADKIIIIGFSFNHSDEHINGILRDCKNKNIFIIDAEIEKVITALESIFYYSLEDYTSVKIQGFDAKKCRTITLIKAKAHAINIQDL
jgi:hypothetical protein